MGSAQPNSNDISPWFLLAAFCCALPILLPTYPAMVDLPQHAAQISMLDSIIEGDYAYGQLFRINWFRPYWLGYGLIFFIGQVTGFVLAAKLTAAIAVVAFPIACALLRKELNAPSILDWLFLLAPFGFAYDWGFLNFLIAAPLGVLFFREYHRYLDGRSSALRVCLWANLMFVAHFLTLAFFCVMFALISFRKGDTLKSYALRVAPLFSAAPVTVLWIVLSIDPSQHFEGSWGLGWFRLHDLLPSMLSMPTTFLSFAVASVLLSIPWILGLRPQLLSVAVVPIAYFLVFMTAAPNAVAGYFFTYIRFDMFGLPLLMYLFRPENCRVRGSDAQPGVIALLLVPALCSGILIKNIYSTLQYDEEAESFRSIVAMIEPERRVLGLVENRKSEFLAAPIYTHYVAWYQAEAKGLVDFNFARYTMNVMYRDEHTTAIEGSISWHPSTFDWEDHNGDLYDYVVVKADPDMKDRILHEGNREHLQLVASAGDWWLYSNVDKGARPVSF